MVGFFRCNQFFFSDQGLETSCFSSINKIDHGDVPAESPHLVERLVWNLGRVLCISHHNRLNTSEWDLRSRLSSSPSYKILPRLDSLSNSLEFQGTSPPVEQILQQLPRRIRWNSSAHRNENITMIYNKLLNVTQLRLYLSFKRSVHEGISGRIKSPWAYDLMWDFYEVRKVNI